MEAFKYGCIVGGEHFCKRRELSRQLSAYIAGGQNVVIQGERRMGKTSLVRETVSQYVTPRPRRRPDTLKGKIRIADDFNAMPEGFEEAFA